MSEIKFIYFIIAIVILSIALFDVTARIGEYK